MLLKNIVKKQNLSLNKKLERWTQSSSLRIALAVAFLTGLLVVVTGTGAQNLLSIKTDAQSNLLKKQQIEKYARIIASFDVRLSGKNNLDNLLRKSSLLSDDSAIMEMASANKTSIETGLANLKAKSPNTEVKGSPLTGAVEIVQNPDGLTKANPGRTGESIVREFISDNKEIYGLSDGEINDLNFIGESISPDSGLRMVRVEQMTNGRPVFQSETRFILDREGRVLTSLGLMVPKASESAGALDNLLSPQDALQRTMAQLDVSLDAGKMEIVKSEEAGMRAEIRANDPNIGGKVTSKLVYFAAAPGVLIPAWSQIVFGVNEDWYVLVDARDGAMLWRKNIRSEASTQDARFRVYVQADGFTPADSPAPQSPSGAVVGAGTQFTEIAPTIVTMFLAQNATASPNGWIDDCPGGVCTANETQTLGNNVLSCLDRAGTANSCDVDAASILDGNGRPTGNADTTLRNRDFLGTTPRDFQTNFLPPPQAGNPEAGQTPTGSGASGTLAIDQFRRGSVTQQFYNANWYHDKLFALGFNTAAGNFQNNIFAGGGVGNDRVLLDVQDASGTNNANFSTPPDGVSGRAQMFRFTGSTIDRDGGLDAEILLHELTHGTSNRLVGNSTGLQWRIGQSMGEGWSDFYAMALLNNTNADNPNANYASGAYATYKFITVTFLDNYVYGIRRFPYSTNIAVNPLTWADVDQTTYNESGGIAVNPLGFGNGGALEVHNAGEIWANTLWEMRSRIIADPAGANGNVPTGNQTSLQIVTDGMKMTPANPTFLQARNALIDADCATNACANEQSIWDGFAKRGLGYYSDAPLAIEWGYTTGHIGIKESFVPTNLDTNTIAVNDSNGNNSGFIDPNEPVQLVINLKNPWRNASKTATGVTASITSSTPGVIIVSGSTTYPNIAPNSNANKNGNNLVIKAPPTAPCGTNLYFTLTMTSSLGTVTKDFSIRMGQPSGTLAPVTYTRSAVGLAIPDNRPSGVIDTMNITDDFEIADLDVRIDSLTHTFVGDVSFGVRGPGGYGSDFISILGGLTDGGSGDNYVNTVADDEAVNDLLSEVSASQPFTKSYLTVFNSPSWVTAGIGTPDAIPQLSRFDGTSTLGAWKAVISDQFGSDTGTLQGWSLIVTPRNFVCTVFVPTAANVGVAGMVTDNNGRALSRVIVALTDSQGITRTAKTNSFGRFQFQAIAAGQTYTLNATAKGYSFVPQVISIDDEIADLNLTAQ